MHTELHDRLEDLYQPYRCRISFAEFLKMLIGWMEARYGPIDGEDDEKNRKKPCPQRRRAP